MKHREKFFWMQIFYLHLNYEFKHEHVSIEFDIIH